MRLPRSLSVGALGALSVLALAAPAAAQGLPNLQTVPPTDFRIDDEEIDGTSRRILRFSNTVQNASPHALQMRGVTDEANQKTDVFQEVLGPTGAVVSCTLVGSFVFHVEHDHWHFQDFALYQIFDEAGCEVAQAAKVTFCIIDTERMRVRQPEQPRKAVYAECGQELQGLSPWWADTYGYYLPDQWIVIDDLPDGIYRVKSTANPGGIILESDETDNAAETWIQITRGRRVREL